MNGVDILIFKMFDLYIVSVIIIIRRTNDCLSFWRMPNDSGPALAAHR